MNLYGSQVAASMESLPYEKFVQRLLGRQEEAGQGEEVTVVRLLVVGEKKAGEDEVFSVSTSPWLLFLQRSGW